MKTCVGIWIDHEKAVIATIAGRAQRMRQLTSNLESHAEPSGRAEDSAEDQRDRRFTHHLEEYYDEVASCVRDAESILIIGPGGAKGELLERLTRQGLRARIVGVEPAARMTDRQVAALVRRRFAEESA